MRKDRAMADDGIGAFRDHAQRSMAFLWIAERRSRPFDKLRMK